VHSRLVRDAHIGLLWEGTSNINGLDIITHAVRKDRAEQALHAALLERLQQPAIPTALRSALTAALDRSTAFARRIADDAALEGYARAASSALYHALSACLLAWEGAAIGSGGGDARRLLLAWLVLRHRAGRHDPFDLAGDAREQEVVDLLLDTAPVPTARAQALLDT
jgi:acyl-CoA dehydrogenase